MQLFPGQPVYEQQASQPVQPPVELFPGQPVDEPDWTDKVADFAGETLETVKKGVIDPAKDVLISAANDFSDWVTGKNTEDYPEIPAVTALSGDFQLADTPVGMMNIIKNQPQYKDKKLDLDQDKYGNPLLLIDGKPHYFNKTGPSLNDYDYLIKGTQSIMPLIVGGVAAAPAKMAAGPAIVGASGGLAEMQDQFAAQMAGAEEGNDPEKVAMAEAYTAGGEAAGRLLVKTLGGVFGKLFGKKTDINQYFDGTKFTDEGIDLLKKNEVSPETLSRMMTDEMKKTGALTAEQAKRYNKFMDQGINPTKAQITQNADDFTFQQQKIKSNEGLRHDLDVQNAQMTTNIDDVAQNTGGITVKPGETGDVLMDHITNKALSADREISKMYQSVRDVSPVEKNIDLSGLVKNIKSNMSQNSTGNRVLSAIWGDLKQRGIINREGKLAGRINVDTAEQIRIKMNQLWKENPGTGRRLMTGTKDALDFDVTRVAGKDWYEKARLLKRKWHEEFSDASAHKFDLYSKNPLERLFNGQVKTGEQAFNQTVKNGPLKDLKRVKLSLHSGTPEQIAAGKQVWDNLRGQVIRDAYDMATTGGRNEMRQKVVNMKAFKKVIDFYKNKADKDTNKLRILFDDSEISELNKIIDLGEMMSPIVGTGGGTGPSGLSVEKLAAMLSKSKIGGLGFGAPRMAAGAASMLTREGDEAAVRAAIEAARKPAQPTVDAIIKGATNIKQAGSVPARLGGLGGLMMLGEQANSQPQRTGEQR